MLPYVFQAAVEGYGWASTAQMMDGLALGETTPVGQYVDGKSPYGVLDAAGNVFQWTSTRFKPGHMTVKGSAWEDFGGIGRGARGSGWRE